MSLTEANRYRNILEASPVFNGLEPAALDNILQRGLLLDAKKGDPVYFENMRGGIGLYLVLEGEVEIFLTKPRRVIKSRSSKVHLNILKPGDCFGEYSLIDGHNTSASAKALVRTRLFFLPRGEFLQAVDSDPLTGKIIYRNFLAFLIERLRKKDVRLKSSKK